MEDVVVSAAYFRRLRGLNLPRLIILLDLHQLDDSSFLVLLLRIVVFVVVDALFLQLDGFFSATTFFVDVDGS